MGSGERLPASTETHRQFAGPAGLVQPVNALNQSKPVRKLLARVLGVLPDAWSPELARQRVRWHPDKDGGVVPVTNRRLMLGKVVIFALCFVNDNVPGIGHDLLKVLRHNVIACELIEKECCCGRPKQEAGDFDGVAKHEEANAPVLAGYSEQGDATLSAVSLCIMMFRRELPLLFLEDPDVEAVQAAMFDPFRMPVGAPPGRPAQTDVITALGRLSHHVPRHERVQKSSSP